MQVQSTVIQHMNTHANPIRIPGISVKQAHHFTIYLCSINTMKPMGALDLPMFLYGAEI